MTPKRAVSGTVRVNAWAAVTEAVGLGVSSGIRRAYKHTDNPTTEAIENEVYEAVLGELCEWFVFDGDDNGDDR